jgi:hypothetical protein
MTTTLRKMLEANSQPQDIPLWITEIGAQAPVRRDNASDEAQAVALAKAYLLSIAAGFDRIFWFEARGPSYGNGMDFGLIRADMTPRPSFNALKVLTSTLGQEPTAAGWLNLGEGGYGFVFDTQKKGAVLAGWSPPKREIDVTFEGDVRVFDMDGGSRRLPGGNSLRLTDKPVLITDLPPTLVEKARAQQGTPYPWAGDRPGEFVLARLKAENIENGVRQIRSDTTIADSEWRRTDFSRPDKEGHYVYFRVDPQFVPYGTKTLEITAVVRRTAPDKVAGMSIDYESNRGYVGSDYRNISDGDGWQEISWKVEDANFVGAWGWNFRLNAIASPSEFLIKEVRVKRVR